MLERARRDPLAGRCHFLGVRDNVPRLLNELTLLVHAARQRMGWNARRRIVAAFQAEHTARHLWQHYQQLCPQLG